MPDRRFLFLTASARPNGNAELLARSAAAALPAETSQVWIDLTAADLPAFHDLRHDGAYADPEGSAATLAAATMAATDVVIVAPLYWYSLPAPAKLYLDHWAHWMRHTPLGFKPAVASLRLWLVMTHASSSPEEIAPAITPLRLSALYMGMTWAGALLGDANRPGDVTADTSAMTRAKTFFQP